MGFVKVIMVVAFVLCMAGLGVAAEPSGADCNGRKVELKCHNVTTGQLCATIMGTSCYNQDRKACAAKSATSPCGAACNMKRECDEASPQCCKGNCGLSYDYRISFWDYKGRCPSDWRP